MTQNNRVIVVGAGVGGLATAIAMRRVGFPVTVLERTQPLISVGAAFGMQSNAILAMQRLGVAAPVLAASVAVETFELRSWSGRRLAHWPQGEIGRGLGAPSVTAFRQVVHEALRDALPEKTIRYGAEVVGCGQESGTAVVHCADGTEERAALVVGADGLRSQIRSELFGRTEPDYAGYTSWRGTTAFHDPAIASGTARQYLGDARTCALWPLPDGKVYWVATRKLDSPWEGAQNGHPSDVADDVSHLCDWFADAPDPILRIIQQAAADQLLRTPIFDRPPLRDWHRGPFVLVGDAAHPMQPPTGQGAAQTLIDALYLARELRGLDLADGPKLDGALTRFTTIRQPVTSALAAESAAMGASHHRRETPLTRLVRAAVLRTTPASAWRRKVAARMEGVAELPDNVTDRHEEKEGSRAR